MKIRLTGLLLTFLLIFPKGGFKVGGLPITWGYLLLSLLSFVLLFNTRIELSPKRLLCLLALIPFQALAIFTITLNGVDDLGAFISLLLHFYLLPFTFFYLLSENLEHFEAFAFIKRGILFIASYGIALFFIKLIFGFFLEIPFITVNGQDFGLLHLKNIDRGTVFKLISTYNNGNIYGICLLMLLPLYYTLEERGFMRFIVRLSLLLTLSRTVWAGLLFVEGMLFFRKKPLILLALSGSLFALTTYFNFKSDFLWDLTLGNRIHQFEFLKTAHLFSSEAFQSLPEITYLGMIHYFGFTGLFFFLVAMLAPLAFQLLSTNTSLMHRAISQGMITYLFVSLSDGAILLIPTMAFYWGLASLLQTDVKRLYIVD